MESSDSDISQLLRRVEQGDDQAMEQLMDKHRGRLRKMISLRIDPRLANRIDPSDVIQETLTVAARRLPAYVRERPLPFYPWLRQIAYDRLVDLHHRHVLVQKRSVTREQQSDPEPSDQSVWELARHFVASETSPIARLVREELHQRARDALLQLELRDREILVMRHLEQMQIGEIAATLELSESAVKMRRLRAIQRLRDLMGVNAEEQT